MNNLKTLAAAIDSHKQHAESLMMGNSIHDMAECVQSIETIHNSILLKSLSCSQIERFIYYDMSSTCEEIIEMLNDKIEEEAQMHEENNLCL